ncbi:MAG TPA: hypothetical protein VGH28_32595 [Polyangiaceae bacterium]|jgi:hypothetical protein
MRRAIFVVALVACHRGSEDPKSDVASSCVIEHEGGVTQCFEDVGPTAKQYGAKYCDEMHGQHTFYAAKACPREGVVGSCTKRPGTDLERVERCYRDEPACAARCEKAGGTYRK